jgi:hypothetical protein
MHRLKKTRKRKPRNVNALSLAKIAAVNMSTISLGLPIAL